MACFRPLKAYRSLSKKTDSGKQLIVFRLQDAGGSYEHIDLPCGQCIGCRIARSRSWALRCVHESSLYDNNCFITLTFSDERINDGGSLVKSHFQKFMKRLRKNYNGLQRVDTGTNNKFPIRYFHCGEYGEKLLRPHHHACLFNFDFLDKELFKVKGGNRLYISESLSELWPFGHHLIGDVTFESASYVARYITKKITGVQGLEHYADLDVENGEILSIREPEYITMSRRPGIGRGWFEKFKDDIYPKDYCTVEGKKFHPPAYYDKIFDVAYPEDFANIKKKRLTRKEELADDNVAKRLKVKELCLIKRLKNSERSYENGN